MMYPISLLLVLLFTRINAIYHVQLLCRKYVVIRRKKLARLLIGQSDPVTPKVKNAKANRNKLTYAGIAFYGMFAVLLVLCVVFALVPDMPANSHPFQAYARLMPGSTLNVMLPSVLTWALLFGEFAFHVLNTSKYAVKKAKAKKFIWAVYAAMFALGVVMTAVCLYLASYAMMHRV